MVIYDVGGKMENVYTHWIADSIVKSVVIIRPRFEGPDVIYHRDKLSDFNVCVDLLHPPTGVSVYDRVVGVGDVCVPDSVIILKDSMYYDGGIQFAISNSKNVYFQANHY